MKRTAGLRRGDLVEVKSPLDILQTLDSDGALGGLPFMPEMVDFCGKKFHVASRALKTCTTISRSTTMRMLKQDDVIVLEGPRCSGVNHDGCQKLCAIFWREAWLHRVEDAAPHSSTDSQGREQLNARLRTTTDARTFFCQASELLKVSDPLSRWGRFGTCFKDIRVGNSGILEMAHRIGTWLFWRIRRRFLGAYARGRNKSTPVQSLNLQAGEVVEVKSTETISETLDQAARNRGLNFTPDMGLLCNSRQKVERRLDKIIVDGTGEMRQLRNTVYLEGSCCGCSHVAFGGCPRQELSYWREIWLRRPDQQ